MNRSSLPDVRRCRLPFVAAIVIPGGACGAKWRSIWCLWEQTEGRISSAVQRPKTHRRSIKMSETVYDSLSLERNPSMLFKSGKEAIATLVIVSLYAGCGGGSTVVVPSDGGADHVSRGDAGLGSMGGRSGTGQGAGGTGGQGNSCSATVSCPRRSVCDIANGACVECLSTADCRMQLCDVATHSCVDCLTSADCPTATPACSSGHTCGATCTTSATCPTALPACETSTHTCVECLIDSDCGPGGMCQSDLTCA